MDTKYYSGNTNCIMFLNITRTYIDKCIYIMKPYAVILRNTLIIITFSLGSTGHCLAEPKLHSTAIQSNNFANALVKLSNYLTKQQEVITIEGLGGYGGLTNNLEFYREEKNINKNNNKIISIVRRENTKQNKLHDIIVNIYDKKGRLTRDYSASYLPVHNRAPDQTLINFYYYRKSLTGFRQFDALNNILFEECKGIYNNIPVRILFEYYDVPDTPDDIKDKTLRQAYQLCFEGTKETAEPYTNPLAEILESTQN